MKVGAWQTYQSEFGRAAATGDPTGLLLADHNWIRTVFEELTLRMTADQSTIRELLPGLKHMAELLDTHIRQEEDVYFPAVRPPVSDRARTWIAAAFPEHEVVRMTEDDFLEAIERRRDLGTDFRSFHSALVQHLDNEEEFIFPEVAANLAEDAARSLAAGMLKLSGPAVEHSQ